MTQAIERNQIRVETGYDYEIKETPNAKTGFFSCSHGWELLKVGFEADENGNVESLTLLEALDGEENPIEFELLLHVVAIKDQIEPLLWNDEPEVERDTMRSLGLTNSDFLYGA